MDVEQRAREILAVQCEADGMPEAAEMIRAGTFKGDAAHGFQTTIRAIIAALTPPEGYALVPVETLNDLASDAEEYVRSTEFRPSQIESKLSSVREAKALLADYSEVKP